MEIITYQIFYRARDLGHWWPWSPWNFQSDMVARHIVAILKEEYNEQFEFEIRSTIFG